MRGVGAGALAGGLDEAGALVFPRGNVKAVTATRPYLVLEREQGIAKASTRSSTWTPDPVCTRTVAPCRLLRAPTIPCGHVSLSS